MDKSHDFSKLCPQHILECNFCFYRLSVYCRMVQIRTVPSELLYNVKLFLKTLTIMIQHIWDTIVSVATSSPLISILYRFRDIGLWMSRFHTGYCRCILRLVLTFIIYLHVTTTKLFELLLKKFKNPFGKNLHCALF